MKVEHAFPREVDPPVRGRVYTTSSLAWSNYVDTYLMTALSPSFVHDCGAVCGQKCVCATCSQLGEGQECLPPPLWLVSVSGYCITQHSNSDFWHLFRVCGWCAAKGHLIIKGHANNMTPVDGCVIIWGLNKQ